MGGFINCGGGFPPQPIVYTSDMTLLDRVMMIQKELTELDNYVKTGDFLKPAYQYTDRKIIELSNDTAKKLKALTDTVNNNKEQFDESITQINASLNNIYSDLTVLGTEIDTKIESAMQTVLYDVEQLLIGYSIYVISPVTGRKTTVQNALNEVYEATALNALTASEYEQVEITVANYDNRMISANDYDRKSRFIFLKELYFSVISPFTGLKETCCDIVNEIVNYLKTDKAITAAEYDALSLSVSDYDNKNITAYNYDWNGKQILI
jgi:hypothetical protein